MRPRRSAAGRALAAVALVAEQLEVLHVVRAAHRPRDDVMELQQPDARQRA